MNINKYEKNDPRNFGPKIGNIPAYDPTIPHYDNDYYHKRYGYRNSEDPY